MHIMMIGVAGMIGRKLSQRIVDEHANNQTEELTLCLVDIVEPDNPIFKNPSITAYSMQADFT